MTGGSCRRVHSGIVAPAGAGDQSSGGPSKRGEPSGRHTKTPPLDGGAASGASRAR
jgi:hypothetical protein